MRSARAVGKRPSPSPSSRARSKRQAPRMLQWRHARFAAIPVLFSIDMTTRGSASRATRARSTASLARDAGTSARSRPGRWRGRSAGFVKARRTLKRVRRAEWCGVWLAGSTAGRTALAAMSGRVIGATRAANIAQHRSGTPSRRFARTATAASTSQCHAQLEFASRDNLVAGAAARSAAT